MILAELQALCHEHLEDYDTDPRWAWDQERMAELMAPRRMRQTGWDW